MGSDGDPVILRSSLFGFAVVMLVQCGSTTSPPPPNCNACTQGATSCSGGIVSTCNAVDGCFAFQQTSTCPSGACQDESTCAMPANCGSLSTCDTCTAPMVINCFWCPTTSACVQTQGQSCPNAIEGGNNAALQCAEAASCAPCAISTMTLCDDTEFECTCTGTTKPTDTNCTLDTGTEWCCTS
jgi:hypothetical protein